MTTTSANSREFKNPNLILTSPENLNKNSTNQPKPYETETIPSTRPSRASAVRHYEISLEGLFPPPRD
jgi:hypothetical protein